MDVNSLPSKLKAFYTSLPVHHSTLCTCGPNNPSLHPSILPSICSQFLPQSGKAGLDLAQATRSLLGHAERQNNWPKLCRRRVLELPVILMCASMDRGRYYPHVNYPGTEPADLFAERRTAALLGANSEVHYTKKQRQTPFCSKARPGPPSNHRWTAGADQRKPASPECVSWAFVGLWLNRFFFLPQMDQKQRSAARRATRVQHIFERASAAVCVYTFSIPVQLPAQQ